MGKIVVVAEKPSVGRDIARVLGCRTGGDGCLIGEQYIVTWAVGHLVTLVEPDELDEKFKKWSFATLPILPETIPLKVIPATRSQFTKVKKLINDKETDSLICATDAGREGELIFRYIYEKAGCKKPFQRLWISSMTDEAIREGFQTIRPGADYDGLYESARCRSKADWLVGMNASRAFTLKYDTLLSIGRVQTPTLAILVKRRKEIENFKPEGFCTLTADFGDYKGVYFSETLDPDTHLKQRADAEEIAAAIKNRNGSVTQAETVRKHEPPPQLYDLTSLQRDANRMLGFTADKTLKTAQSLYEKHKALTYPRTDSRYLPMKQLPESYRKYIDGALPGGKLPVTRRTIDQTKVTDHHAIIPTARKADPSKFSEDERKLFDMVARRLIVAFYPACDYDATKIITQVGDHSFRTTGKVIVNNGWHDVPPLENPPKPKKKTKPDDESDNPLPPLKEGDERQVKATAIKEDVTKPPAPHTDASLLAAMETAGKELDDEELVRQMKGSGIGTPATRAAIIERLLHVGYAQRRGKTLQATDKGVMLIDVGQAVQSGTDRPVGTGSSRHHRRETGSGAFHGRDCPDEPFSGRLCAGEHSGCRFPSGTAAERERQHPEQRKTVARRCMSPVRQGWTPGEPEGFQLHGERLQLHDLEGLPGQRRRSRADGQAGASSAGKEGTPWIHRPADDQGGENPLLSQRQRGSFGQPADNLGKKNVWRHDRPQTDKYEVIYRP